jgi:ubiquitin-protein ligase
MPRYQVYFDTPEGEKKFNVDIDDGEVLEDVLRDILAELSERGHMLAGTSTGDLKVIWNGHELDLTRPLPEQQVQPNDLLRVLVESYEGGAHSLRLQRIEQEWKLLEKLESLNPEFIEILQRKSRPTEEIFYLRLLQSPGVEEINGDSPLVREEHTVRLCFPRFYPDVPIECYVKEPLSHPNVRLETGFVCLWERFSLGDTVIQAVCRAQATAAYRMVNLREEHLMNLEAARWYSEIAKPKDLVPLSSNEIKVFELVSGRLQWLEPGRGRVSSSRQWDAIV